MSLIRHPSCNMSVHDFQTSYSPSTYQGNPAHVDALRLLGIVRYNQAKQLQSSNDKSVASEAEGVQGKAPVSSFRLGEPWTAQNVAQQRKVLRASSLLKPGAAPLFPQYIRSFPQWGLLRSKHDQFRNSDRPKQFPCCRQCRFSSHTICRTAVMSRGCAHRS